MKTVNWTRIVAIFVCLSLLVISACGRQEDNIISTKNIEAQYPEVPQHPEEEDYRSDDGTLDYIAYERDYKEWEADCRNRARQSEGYKDGIRDFSYTTMKEFLSGADDENKVYSPLNVYMALSMLAEVSDGNSREQILNLLEVDNIKDLREKSSALWRANYNDDGTVTSILANSLWLNEDIEFEQDTLNVLAENYYASSYSGQMGSDAFNTMLQEWINEQTGGLLKEQAEGIELDSETVMALASTIYYKARWSGTFFEENTEKNIFHSSDGDIECDFMYQEGKKDLYWGEKFTSVYKELENSGNMWLVLPDEGVSLDALLADKEVMDMVMDASAWENKKELIVNLYMPKFDISSDINLSEGLKNLGVTDVFNSEVSDFSPIAKEVDGISLSKAEHAARVMVDEEGCEATAFTVMVLCGAALEIPPDEEIDFVLDRPFLFILTGADGTPLFAGVVNQPS